MLARMLCDALSPPAIIRFLAIELENAKKLVSQCCVLGRAGAVELPYGLIVPASSSQGKTVQVVCRGRPVNGTDVSCIKMVCASVCVQIFSECYSRSDSSFVCDTYSLRNRNQWISMHSESCSWFNPKGKGVFSGCSRPNLLSTWYK